MKMKVTMANAWEFARRGAKKFGGKVKEYLAEALKLAWALYKAQKERKGGQIAGIAPWFLQKTFNNPSVVHQIQHESIYKIKKATKKAYLIEAIATFENGKVEVKNEFWAPKSVVVA
jgi:Streptococcus thermophilus bacteriophage Gp111 protein